MWWHRSRRRRTGDELQFHRDQLIADLVAKGIDAREARRRAMLEFGNAAALADQCWDVRGHWFEDLFQDLRYAFRTIRRSPGFALVVVLSLALGIGANTAIFSVINAVLLRSLPVTGAPDLVRIGRVLQNGNTGLLPYPVFEDLRGRVASASGMFAMTTASPAVVIGGVDETVATESVSDDYALVLGLVPHIGRMLNAADNQAASALSAVITDGYWVRRFNRDPAVLGMTLSLRDRVFTIVGVTSAGFQGAQAGRAADVILPLARMLPDEQKQSMGFNALSVFARRRPGATIAQIDAEVQVHVAALLQAKSAGLPENRRADFLRQRTIAYAAPGGFNPARDALGRPLLILMGTAGLILLLACVNLSGLLVARAAARRREISIRLAIGAGRGRLVRQCLTESLVLALLGGALGLAAASPFAAWLLALFVRGRDLAFVVAPDARVLAFTAVVSLLACLVAGVVPAMQAAAVNVNTSLKQVRAHGHTRLSRMLVVVQLAISMMLLVGTTLFVGTLVNLYRVERGFDSHAVLVVKTASASVYPPERALRIRMDLLDRLAALSTVRSATAGQTIPVGGGLWDRTVEVEGYAFGPDESKSVGFNMIAPDYFATLGTAVLNGREFGRRDVNAATSVAIVNDSFVKKFFGRASAIGRHVTSVGVTYEIVGVVRDAKYEDLRSPMLGTMYVPWGLQQGEQPGAYSYLVRVNDGNPAQIAPELDRLVRAADPALRVRTAITYDELIDRSIVTERVLATLGGVFGILALTVAALGMFGVLAFQVARRTNELGVRMVLGATRWSMVRLVFGGLLSMLVPGLLIGSGLAFLVTGLAGKLLFGVESTDLRVFVVAGSVLTVTVLLAGWLPARRASSIDPIVALRQE